MMDKSKGLSFEKIFNPTNNLVQVARFTPSVKTDWHYRAEHHTGSKTNTDWQKKISSLN